MPLEIERSDVQPGDFQRIPFLPLFRSPKRQKNHYLMNLRRYDLRSTNTKKHQRQRLASAHSNAPNRNDENTDPTDTRVPDLQQ